MPLPGLLCFAQYDSASSGLAPAQLQPESSSGYPFQWLVTNAAHLGCLNQKLERQHAISSFYCEDFFPILAECTWDIQVKNVKTE